jgi:exopolysaccharide biosynthesis polyprenyl glycosylphosphotransferase
MGEISSSRLWDMGSKDYPSQFARMIPGTHGAPLLKLESRVETGPKFGTNDSGRSDAKPQSPTRTAGASIGTTPGRTDSRRLTWLDRLRQFASKQRQCDAEPRKVLIVGGGPVGRSIARALRNDPDQRSVVCGFVDDKLPLSSAVLGRVADLEWLARAEFVDEVILALPGQPVPMRAAAEVALRNRLDIRAVPDLPPGPWPGSGVDHIGEVPVITLHREALPNAALFLKRALDVGGAALALVLASPLMAAIALLIRLGSTGTAIYVAERTGAKGRRFRCYKFRSMTTNAEHLKEDLRKRNQRQGPIFKIEDDPRVTRIGRFIRRYSLDELPQLWNVLRGEMSLVGPRPHPVDEVNHYELQDYRRLDMKPGMTGLWQITARGCPSFELNMHLDLTYIENWSLRLDFMILASTIRVLFAPDGA